MRAGLLRHKVTIEEPTAGTADSYSATADTWSTLAIVWAEIEDIYGSEGVYAMQVHPDATLQVTIRYRSDVELHHRINYGTRYLYPVAIQRDNARSKYLILMCKEEV